MLWIKVEAQSPKQTPNGVLQLTVAHDTRLATPSLASCATAPELWC